MGCFYQNVLNLNVGLRMFGVLVNILHEIK